MHPFDMRRPQVVKPYCHAQSGRASLPWHADSDGCSGTGTAGCGPDALEAHADGEHRLYVPLLRSLEVPLHLRDAKRVSSSRPQARFGVRAMCGSSGADLRQCRTAHGGADAMRSAALALMLCKHTHRYEQGPL